CAACATKRSSSIGCDGKVTLPRIILTSGEPAGIGPDLCIALAARSWPCDLIVAADRQLIEARARALHASIQLSVVENLAARVPQQSGTLRILHVPANTPVTAGRLDK